MRLVVAGVLLLVAGVVLIYLIRKKKNKLHVLDLDEVKNVKEIGENYAFFREEYGRGSFALQVEVKGTIGSENPIVSSLAERDCVYYTNKITREYETTVTSLDQDGRRVSRNVRRSEVVAENEQYKIPHKYLGR